MTKGVVIRSTGSWYDIQLEDGKVVPGRIVGKFRLLEKPVTNPVAVGDYVTVNVVNGEETVMITDILERKNYVVRQSPRKKHQLHILAANIDQAVLVITIVNPNLKQGFIDRFLMMTEPYDIPVHIVFNKSDTYTEGDIAIYDYLKQIYETIGYSCSLVSAKEKQGIEGVRSLLKDKRTLFSGQSGVGKSTLINSLQEGLELRTADISEYTGKGQHTTTFAEMFQLSEGGEIIDTPGIKTLGFNHFDKMDVAHNFKEIFAASDGCKFNNCFHGDEPKCNVKQLVESGEISELRYFNYAQLIDEVEQQNYWERKKEY